MEKIYVVNTHSDIVNTTVCFTDEHAAHAEFEHLVNKFKHDHPTICFDWVESELDTYYSAFQKDSNNFIQISITPAPLYKEGEGVN